LFLYLFTIYSFTSEIVMPRMLVPYWMSGLPILSEWIIHGY
jgi:hypothetical protein